MNLNCLFGKTIRTRAQLFNHQIVRWRRPKKPFWLGLAKSKMFVVPERKKIHTPEETKENWSLYSSYNTAYKALLNFIEHDNPYLKELTVFDTAEGDKVKYGPALEARIAESLKNNDIWNSESARRRDERLKLNMERNLERVIQHVHTIEESKQKEMEIIEEVVRKEKNLSQFYITPENLDEAIENCLNKIDCFDFAIDLEGNKYHGRESLSSEQPKRDINQLVAESF